MVMINILREYNFWDGQKIETGFFRKSYLKNISSYLNNKLVKVLLGQRRTGKSYIFRMLIKELIEKHKVSSKNILYINKDIRALDFIDSASKLDEIIRLYIKELVPKGKIYIFLDEVQEIIGWEKSVNSMSQDYTRKFEIFITGSNANLLSSELSTYLSGRYMTINIYPFSYTEFLGFFKLKRNKESYIKYLNTGGIPELYNLSNKELKINYISALKDSIILRDIIQRHNIRDVNLLNRLIDFVIDTQASLFSPNKIVKTLKSLGVKTNIETISTYLNYLTETFFIYEAFRFDLKGKRILAGERKYYLNDLSFKYYLSSSFDRGISHFLENAVYLHYKRNGYNVFIGKLKDKEIDFIVEKNNIKKYVQVAYMLTDENVIKREFGNLLAIKDNYEKLVVTLDDLNIGIIDGVKHINAWSLYD